MYGLARAALFRLDPERAHGLAMRYLRGLERSPRARTRVARRAGAPDPRLAMGAFGQEFRAPLGMAAGFDKAAEVPNALLALGFSHVEVGTVTPRAQAGNPRPRLERYPSQRALVNRLGFNNPGMEVVAQRLAARAREGIVGANIGKNKDTPEKDAVEDYLDAAAALAPHADYLVVNVSSPNTPGLRRLQEPRALAHLVGAVMEALDDADAARPVLLKLHPDAADDELVASARAAVDAGAAGIVAVNTTTARPPGLEGAGAGGLSGEPLRDRATEVTRLLFGALRGNAPIVGVGGIFTGADALARVRAGATLLQAYTGFVYRGPRFPALVHRELIDALDAVGVDRLSEAVGEAR